MQAQSLWMDEIHGMWHSKAMSNFDTDLPAIGQRLAALRQALGFTNASAFARLVGLSVTTLQNYEAGIRRPDVGNAILICRATGVTLDWIYQGLTGGLPVHIASRLTQQEPIPRRHAS
jgi:transcriptional regulator with XRE-family HTH domain